MADGAKRLRKVDPATGETKFVSYDGGKTWSKPDKLPVTGQSRAEVPLVPAATAPPAAEPKSPAEKAIEAKIAKTEAEAGAEQDPYPTIVRGEALVTEGRGTKAPLTAESERFANREEVAPGESVRRAGLNAASFNAYDKLKGAEIAAGYPEVSVGLSSEFPFVDVGLKYPEQQRFRPMDESGEPLSQHQTERNEQQAQTADAYGDNPWWSMLGTGIFSLPYAAAFGAPLARAVGTATMADVALGGAAATAPQTVGNRVIGTNYDYGPVENVTEATKQTGLGFLEALLLGGGGSVATELPIAAFRRGGEKIWKARQNTLDPVGRSVADAAAAGAEPSALSRGGIAPGPTLAPVVARAKAAGLKDAPAEFAERELNQSVQSELTEQALEGTTPDFIPQDKASKVAASRMESAVDSDLLDKAAGGRVAGSGQTSYGLEGATPQELAELQMSERVDSDMMMKALGGDDPLMSMDTPMQVAESKLGGAVKSELEQRSPPEAGLSPAASEAYRAALKIRKAHDLDIKASKSRGENDLAMAKFSEGEDVASIQDIKNKAKNIVDTKYTQRVNPSEETLSSHQALLDAAEELAAAGDEKSAAELLSAAEQMSIDPKDVPLMYGPQSGLMKFYEQMPAEISGDNVQTQISLLEKYIDLDKKRGGPEETELKGLLKDMLKFRNDNFPGIDSAVKGSAADIARRKQRDVSLGLNQSEYETDMPFGEGIESLQSRVEGPTPASESALRDLEMSSGQPFMQDVARARETARLEKVAPQLSDEGDVARKALGPESARRGTIAREIKALEAEVKKLTPKGALARIKLSPESSSMGERAAEIARLAKEGKLLNDQGDAARSSIGPNAERLGQLARRIAKLEKEALALDDAGHAAAAEVGPKSAEASKVARGMRGFEKARSREAFQFLGLPAIVARGAARRVSAAKKLPKGSEAAPFITDNDPESRRKKKK